MGKFQKNHKFDGYNYVCNIWPCVAEDPRTYAECRKAVSASGPPDPSQHKGRPHKERPFFLHIFSDSRRTMTTCSPSQNFLQ
jgi:hypothetical protein